MKANIKISGNIISELSEKIPNNIIALNELIKNSYDAGASQVNIELDSSQKTLTIHDDGSGMNREDINTLFHISNSTKEYGKINEYKRFTQGSKGLGFLSVFKFGNTVTWKTKKDNGYSFTVDFNELLSCHDINSFDVSINRDEKIKKGTLIQIMIDDYNLSFLKDYLSTPQNTNKIIHAFDDNNFTIKLTIDDQPIIGKGLVALDNILPVRRLYAVSYNSITSNLIFKINDKEAIKTTFLFPNKDVVIDIQLIIFHLRAYDKSKINPIFLNNHNDLTPLIYVNSNLFNNYSIFDPNVMRNIKTSSVLAQMIGYIKITSCDSQVNFNSDRSQFLQNQLTDMIIEKLKDLNIAIQETGSQNKQHLIDFDILKNLRLPHALKTADEDSLRQNIKGTFTFRDRVKIKKEEHFVTYSLFGKEATAIFEEKAPIQPASIKLSAVTKEIPIISPQINLRDFIEKVTSSENVEISKESIDIFINGEKSHNTILPSCTEECNVKVRFVYNDSNTGMTAEEITLVFYERKNELLAGPVSSKLLSLPTPDSYIINFDPHISNLMDQLNELNLNRYLQVVACSIRALFEISVSRINQTPCYNSLYSNISALDAKVVKTIDYILDPNYKRVEAIDNNTRLGYHDLKNKLETLNFSSAIKQAHLAAHGSTRHITETQVKDLLHHASYFIVVANEMINNNI